MNPSRILPQLFSGARFMARSLWGCPRLNPNDSSWNPSNNRIVRDGLKDDGIGTNDRTISNADIAEEFGPCSDIHIITDHGNTVNTRAAA